MVIALQGQYAVSMVDMHEEDIVSLHLIHVFGPFMEQVDAINHSSECGTWLEDADEEFMSKIRNHPLRTRSASDVYLFLQEAKAWADRKLAVEA